MDKYQICVDVDNHIWLKQGNKMYTYEKLDNMPTTSRDISQMQNCDIQGIMDRWGLQLVAEGTNLKTAVAEAKLELLLRQ